MGLPSDNEIRTDVKAPLPLDYRESGVRVRWWWHYIYSPSAPRRWIIALIVLFLFAIFACVFALAQLPHFGP
jgi:hypothetical protein